MLPLELDSKAFSIKSIPLTPSSIGGNSAFSNAIFLMALAAPFYILPIASKIPSG